MWKRNWQENLLTISQTRDRIYTYFSSFAASLPCHTPPRPRHPISTIVQSTLCPRKVTLMDHLSLPNGRHSQAVEGQGERDVGCLPPTALSFSTTFLAVAEYLPNNSSQQTTRLLWLQLSPVTVILFPSHPYLPLHPFSSGPGVIIDPCSG